MSTCGGIGNDTVCPQDCKYFEKSLKDEYTCTYNPFSNICTCLEAQVDRDGEK
jgi:hypothetical protein